MTHDTSLEELNKRRKKALEMGGAEKLAKRKADGVLNARERINYLADANSFIESGLLARSNRPEAKERTPADGKVTGFCRGNRSLNSFEVSHFPDQNHIRVHSQNATQCLREARNIDPNFSLIDCRFFVVVVVLNWVFQRDDMVIDVVVHPVNHAGQSGRLS